MGVSCSKTDPIIAESNIDVPSPGPPPPLPPPPIPPVVVQEIIEEPPLPEISFIEVIKEIEECDSESNQIRIEQYELKGFNSMVPSIIQEKTEELKNIKVKSLIKKESVIDSIFQYKITNEIIEEISEVKTVKYKHEGCDFSQIKTDECSINKYGNINIINCIYMLIEKNPDYFKNLFDRFDTTKEEYEIKLYQNGKTIKMLFDNRTVKNTPFISCPPKNFFMYLIEKGIAHISGHFFNIMNLLASELFHILTPYNIEVYNHSEITTKKNFYDIIKENLAVSQYILFAEKYFYGNEFYERENYISFFITRIFRCNKRRYIELYLPYKSDDVSLTNIIQEEDLESKKYFPNEKVSNKNYIFLKFDNFLEIFKNTYILRMEPKFYYAYKQISLQDSNINLLKFSVQNKTKVELSIVLPRMHLFRFVLSRLNVSDKLIRRIKTMSSKNGEESNSFYQVNIDYDFEYLDSIYEYNKQGVIKAELEEGTYCLLFNVYRQNGINITLTSISDSELEFLSTDEKISEEKLHSQIKTLFISYAKKNYSNKFNINDNNSQIAYESIYNNNFGYSIYMVDNLSSDNIIYLSLYTEVEGMNLITKEYSDNSSLINILVPPKNNEIIVFEWEKTYNEIFIFLNPTFSIDRILPTFQSDMFNSTNKQYIAKTDVYYMEIRYRRGVFLIFVNENKSDNYILHLVFTDIDNLEYKGESGEIVEGRNFEVLLYSRSFHYCNLKSIEPKDFSYKINIKVTKAKPKFKSKDSKQLSMMVVGDKSDMSEGKGKDSNMQSVEQKI